MKPDTPLTATQLDLYQSYAAHDPDKLTHSERRLVATIAAIRTQLEQAQQRIAELQEWVTEPAEARETALREALEEVRRWNQMGDMPSAVLEIIVEDALSGEGS